MTNASQSAPIQGPKHRLRWLTWWTVSGPGYSSVMLAIFLPRRPVLGVWLHWAHDLHWRNVRPSLIWHKWHLGPILVKVARRSAVERQTARNRERN